MKNTALRIAAVGGLALLTLTGAFCLYRGQLSGHHTSAHEPIFIEDNLQSAHVGTSPLAQRIKPLLEAGKTQAAIRACRERLKVAPEDREAWEWLGVALVEQRQYAPGIDALRRAFGMGPHQAATGFNLALAYSKAGRYPEALSAFRQVQRIDRTYRAEEVAVNIGEIYIEQGDPIQAVKELKKKERELKKELRAGGLHRPSIYDTLGLAYARRGDYRAALDAFETARKYDPEYTGRWVLIANCYRKLGELEKGRALLKKAAQRGDPRAKKKLREWNRDTSTTER